MDMVDHFERVIRELGIFAIRALIKLNAIAVLLASSLLSVGEPPAPGLSFFLWGLVLGFLGLLASYVLAQMLLRNWLYGGAVPPAWLGFALQVVPQALSLLCFVLGILAAFASAGGV